MFRLLDLKHLESDVIRLKDEMQTQYENFLSDAILNILSFFIFFINIVKII